MHKSAEDTDKKRLDHGCDSKEHRITRIKQQNCQGKSDESENTCHFRLRPPIVRPQTFRQSIDQEAGGKGQKIQSVEPKLAVSLQDIRRKDVDIGKSRRKDKGIQKNQDAGIQDLIYEIPVLG